jgi:LysM repeat protein
MNDKNRYGDENMTEEPENEGFDSGKELKGFSGDEDELSFGSKKEKEGYLPDFTDEMEYSAMGREKSGFFSKLFSLPSISVGWLGLFLVVLVALFLFLPEANRTTGNEQVKALSDRMKNLEEQLAQMPKPSETPKTEAAGLSTMKETNDRIDALEKSLATATNQLKNEMEALKAAFGGVKSKPAVEKSTAGRKPVIEKPAPKNATAKKATDGKASEPAKIKYHMVKSGENLYRIALKYGLKEAELRKLNNMGKSAIIVPGQKLRVSK